jgi:hypothetical protein
VRETKRDKIMCLRERGEKGKEEERERGEREREREKKKKRDVPF